MQPRTTEDTLVPSSNLQVSNGRGTQDWQADASADAGPSVGCSGGGGRRGSWRNASTTSVKTQGLPES